jgi:hypothetical protein
MTSEETVALADLLLRNEDGEIVVDQATLDAEMQKVILAEDHTALNLARKILSGRPYGVLSDNPIMLARAKTIGEYVNASFESRQFDIGKDELVDMHVFYPRQHHVRSDDKPRLRVVR